MPFKLEPVGLVTRTPSVKRGDFSTNLLNHNSLHVFAGCLQLLKIYWNLKILLEISWNLIGPAGIGPDAPKPVFGQTPVGELMTLPVSYSAGEGTPKEAKAMQTCPGISWKFA